MCSHYKVVLFSRVRAAIFGENSIKAFPKGMAYEKNRKGATRNHLIWNGMPIPREELEREAREIGCFQDLAS